MSGDLAPEGRRWLAEVESSDAVLAIDYFGFTAPAAWWKAVRATGCLTIEDASQALLTSGVGRHADYVVYSPRKFLGVPDGGILMWRKAAAAPGPRSLEPAPVDGWMHSFEATWLRREQDGGGVSGPWFDRFRAGEAAQPCGPFSMSSISRRALEGGWDLREAVAVRRRNYRRLRDALRPWALFADLPPGVAPLGFPVRLPNRDEVRAALIRERIFPPIHWPIHGAVPERFAASHRLAAELMTLPCDQRYGSADMDRIVSVFRSARPGKWVAKPPVAGEA
jgi:dTDP-4-amino-4,6-dideoxygalactose transaminase